MDSKLVKKNMNPSKVVIIKAFLLTKIDTLSDNLVADILITSLQKRSNSLFLMVNPPSLLNYYSFHSWFLANLNNLYILSNLSQKPILGSDFSAHAAFTRREHFPRN